MQVVVDCAGSAMGGARRFLDELTLWLEHNPAAPITVIGRDQSMTARYLVGRELRGFATRRPGGRRQRVVAINNVGAITAGTERWVLLRNALHFPLPGEQRRLPRNLAGQIALQSSVVRLAVRRADVVVVPTSTMGERVLRHLPALANRLVVIPHPVTPRPRIATTPGLVVCPVLFAPYKQMREHLDLLTQAVALVRAMGGGPVTVRVTASRQEMAAVGHDDGLLTPIGRLGTRELAELLSQAQVIHYPTTLESFGYPLAEARANGQAVVAPESAQAREVAGPALVPYAERTPESLASALNTAMTGPPPPQDPAPFCPDTYFRRWLT